MLIQDLNFFEQIDNLDGIQGGSSITSATSEKPGANAAARAEGDQASIKTSATGNGVSVSTVLGTDLNGDVLTLDQLLFDSGIGDFMSVTLI